MASKGNGYEVVLEKDSKVSKNNKEKYKSLALKAKKVSSDEEALSSDSEDEEYAMVVRDFKNDEDEDLNKDEICLMAHDSNEVINKNKHLKTGKNAAIKVTEDLAHPDPYERDLASLDEGIQATIAVGTNLKPVLQNRTNFVQITKKTSPSTTVGNTKQTSALKLGQGLVKSKIQTRPKMPLRRPNSVFPKSNYNQVN
ncbi:hypothetical protein Tco_0992128 [Tanacetum coccineum]|uniref:Uncharacterized protein n=1 Tax=Tanacetum coccineum TaxID=301880 RepID=A0ABQ5F1M5_9ASTR